MTMTAASLPYYKSHDKAIAEHTLASVFSCIYDNVILEHNSKCDVHSKTSDVILGTIFHQPQV